MKAVEILKKRLMALDDLLQHTEGVCSEIKEIKEAISELKALKSRSCCKLFASRSQWYYITPNGAVGNFIVHSGLSPSSAYTLSKVHTLYSTWEEANEALIEYNKVFTTFKGAEIQALQQPNSCKGCKSLIVYGKIESCLKYEKDEILCVRRNTWLDRYEPKEQ